MEDNITTIEELNATIEALKEQNQALSSENETLKEQNQALSAENKELEEENLTSAENKKYYELYRDMYTDAKKKLDRIEGCMKAIGTLIEAIN